MSSKLTQNYYPRKIITGKNAKVFTEFLYHGKTYYKTKPIEMIIGIYNPSNAPKTVKIKLRNVENLTTLAIAEKTIKANSYDYVTAYKFNKVPKDMTILDLLCTIDEGESVEICNIFIKFK